MICKYVEAASETFYIMAEEYVINESYSYPQIVSPSEMTPLVSGSGDSRNRITSSASVSSWEKVGSGDDECDNEVRYLCWGKQFNCFVGTLQAAADRTEEGAKILSLKMAWRRGKLLRI